MSGDFYGELVSEALGIQPHEVDPQQRQVVKNGMFAIVYGVGVKPSREEMVKQARDWLNMLSREKGPVN